MICGLWKHARWYTLYVWIYQKKRGSGCAADVVEDMSTTESAKGPGDQMWIKREAYHCSVKGDSWVIRNYQEAYRDSSLLGIEEKVTQLHLNWEAPEGGVLGQPARSAVLIRGIRIPDCCHIPRASDIEGLGWDPRIWIFNKISLVWEIILSFFFDKLFILE